MVQHCPPRMGLMSCCACNCPSCILLIARVRSTTKSMALRCALTCTIIKAHVVTRPSQSSHNTRNTAMRSPTRRTPRRQWCQIRAIPMLFIGLCNLRDWFGSWESATNHCDVPLRSAQKHACQMSCDVASAAPHVAFLLSTTHNERWSWTWPTTSTCKTTTVKGWSPIIAATSSVFEILEFLGLKDVVNSGSFRHCGGHDNVEHVVDTLHCS